VSHPKGPGLTTWYTRVWFSRKGKRLRRLQKDTKDTKGCGLSFFSFVPFVSFVVSFRVGSKCLSVLAKSAYHSW